MSMFHPAILRHIFLGEIHVPPLLQVAKSSAPQDLKYYGKRELPKEDQERIKNVLTSTTNAIRVPSKNINIERSDFVDLTSHIAFVSSDVIDAYQHILKEAEGQRCIYSTTFLYQTIGTAIVADILLNDLTEREISKAKYWFIPLFDFDHWHLLALISKKESTSTSRPLKTLNTTLCDFVENFLQNNLPDLFRRRETHPVDWEKINMEDIPMQDQSNDCAIFILAYEEYLQKRWNMDIPSLICFDGNCIGASRWMHC
uniref:Ubiquitin-like protease family profile domain-containing protein n=1 Tax=Ananas comosus var. bracteatus TaxID=296719 RepID=A0A6V7NZJ0_ANACO|nr:unnamed protein product [Ananas comosus var. bracteatus]